MAFKDRWFRFGFFNLGDLYLMNERERILIKAMSNLGLNDKGPQISVLDVGCGTGNNLADFIKYGFLPQNLFGIDINKNQLKGTYRLHSNLNIITADARYMPFASNTFDVCLSFDLFAVIEPSKRKTIADEIIRVLKPGGVLLWFDLRLKSNNPNVWAVPINDIRKLFKGFTIYLKSIGLVPPLARHLSRYSIILTYTLSLIPILRSHLCGALIKPNKT
ncbi:MAG: class I SAM-dependent methyltransferase [bacterium]